MSLRRATSAEDFDCIAALQALTLPDDRPCALNVGAWWVAHIGGDPVAFAGVRPSSHWSDCLYLCRSGVVPEWRGKGLQKRLIAVRERYAKAQGAAWLISDTTHNPASANSLAARGFRRYEPAVPWGGRHTLYWRKRIA